MTIIELRNLRTLELEQLGPMPAWHRLFARRQWRAARAELGARYVALGKVLVHELGIETTHAREIPIFLEQLA